ncbi:hypothetical protein PpBr36_05464 [Pyricularia pennisetigena]|uniref:hypothetical protein n=1 Tax=Pyricularia pennisetigena TaxID=1578925 RepID=UPI0011536EAF|nr:hypothetical protein PpBr36_05464 [Pyricularia pennisetigena]TLS27448.1 hypothetical protein PpBr36_05464 [Pyricularia pennisetigena]
MASRPSSSARQDRAPRPTSGRDFHIAIFCALVHEADAVVGLFDHHWDDGDPLYGRDAGRPNAYSVGAIGSHNVVLVHMAGMGQDSGRATFPGIKLALVVGVCGAVPRLVDGREIVLGDVIISEGLVQYDLGRRLPGRFVRKRNLQDSLGRQSSEIRSRFGKTQKTTGTLQTGSSATDCGCSGPQVVRNRLAQGDAQLVVHVGLSASGDTVHKSGEDRDELAKEDGVKAWQRYAAATAAACAKAFWEFRDKTRYPESRNAVATTWLVSFDQIQRNDGAAADMLSFLCWIEPKAIPRALLPDFESADTENAIGTLCGYAFLTVREIQISIRVQCGIVISHLF